jgi:HK97 family phage major capsid protein
MGKRLHNMPDFPEIPAGLIVFGGVVNDVSDRIVALKEKAADLKAEIDEIIDAADGEDRDLTDDEIADVTAKKAEMTKVTAQIEARQAVTVPSAGRKTNAEPDNSGRKGRTGGGRTGTSIPAQPKDAKDAATFGFESFGAFALSVHAAAADDGKAGDAARERLSNAVSTYGNESTGADGGFIVPPDFRNQIWTKVLGEESLVSRTEQLVTSGNGITIPADETAPWDTSTGIQAYWESEGGAKTPSKPAFEPKTARLNKLICFVPVTDELLEDAPALESWLRIKAPQKMTSKLNTALIRGNGVGMPLGVLEAPSLVTISKETSQNVDTVVGANISKMWGRMYAPSRRNAVWLVNQDVESQLDFLSFPDAGSGFPVPLYVPQGGLSASPFSTLKGRPVIPVEAMSTIGDLGDIMLVDWSQYMTVTKGRDIKTDVSIHMYFDQDITAFRFVLRITGQPLWKSAITPQFGNLTRSWAVALEARA